MLEGQLRVLAGQMIPWDTISGFSEVSDVFIRRKLYSASYHRLVVHLWHFESSNGRHVDFGSHADMGRTQCRSWFGMQSRVQFRNLKTQ